MKTNQNKQIKLFLMEIKQRIKTYFLSYKLKIKLLLLFIIYIENNIL